MDYTDIGLTPQLNSVDSLAEKNKGTITTGYEFVTENERGAVTKGFLGSAVVGSAQIEDASITTAKIVNAAITSAKIGTAAVGNAQLGTAVIGTANIGTLSFNEISGGTAILGGTNDQNGKLVIYNSTGTVALGSFSKDGVRLQDTTGVVRFICPPDSNVAVNALDIGGTLNPSLGTPDGVFNIWDSSGSTYLTADVEFGLRIIKKPLTIYGTQTQNAPGNNEATLYVDQSGTKDRLMVRFNTGTAQQIAIEA